MNPKFSSSALAELTSEARRERLRQLEEQLAAKLPAVGDFSECVRHVMEDLADLGHNFELVNRGADIVIALGDSLHLAFRRPNTVDASWHYRLLARGAEFVLSGYPVGFVVEGDPAAPRGRRLESHPATGGHVVSRRHHDGGSDLRLEGPLPAGKSDEAHAIKVLLHVLNATGRVSTKLDGAEDSRGEDGRILIDGREVAVQVVSVPSHPVWWRKLSHGEVHDESGTTGDAIRFLREAFEKKRDRAAGTLLVLNAAHLGAVIGPDVILTYLATHPDPRNEFGLYAAWLVGPGARSTFPFE